MARRSMALGVLLLCCPTLALAQEFPLARFLSNSLASAALISRPLTGADATSQGDNKGHFYNEAIRQQAPADLDASLAVQMTTFPPAFAWGAAAPAPGVSTERRMRGAGLSYVELPSTLGRGRVTFSVGRQAVEFGKIDGVNLRGTSLALTTAHDDCCAPVGSSLNPEFERDLLQQRFNMDVEHQTHALFAAVGVTDRLDIGVMVPMVVVRLDARVTSRILRTATAETYVFGFQTPTGAAVPVPHAYDAIEIANRTTYYHGQERGIGDVLVKVKYRMAGVADGIALSLGAYLPTGNRDKLLGAGVFRGDASLLMSRSIGKFNPHLNVGYTFAPGSGSDLLGRGITTGAAVPSSTSLPDVAHVIAGLDWAAHRRVQFSVDAVGRRLTGLPRFTTPSKTFPSRGPGASGAAYVASDNLTVDGQGSPLQIMGIAGTRVFVATRLLCTLEVLLPVNAEGLLPRVGAVAGLSWGF